MSIKTLLFKNIVWRGLFYACSLLLNVVIARHFKADETGSFYYIITIGALAVLILSLSLEAGIVYFASSGKTAPLRLFNLSLAWVITSALLLTMAYFVIKNFVVDSLLFSKMIFAIAFICGNLLINFMGGLFYAEKKFMFPNIVGILITLCLIFIIASADKLWWLTNNMLIAIYFASFLLQGIILAIAFLFKEKRWEIIFPSAKDLRKIFSYCSLVFASNLLTFFVYRVDYWFVHHYRSAAELGNYIEVSKIAQIFFVLPGILAGAVFPLTAGGQREEVKARLMIISRSILFLYGAICLFLAVTGKWLFSFIFGASFDNMYLPFLLLIPGILGLSTLYTLTAYYAGKNKAIVNVKGSFIALMVIIIGDALFVPLFGIYAAALVSSVAYILYHIFVLRVFAKEYNVSTMGFFLFKYTDLLSLKRYVRENLGS